MIVGTDLKQVERITGRLTTGKVALGGALSGLWLGLFVGVIFSLFDGQGSAIVTILSTGLFGIGLRPGLGPGRDTPPRAGSATSARSRSWWRPATRCWWSTSCCCAAQELLAQLPGGRPDPFA